MKILITTQTVDVHDPILGFFHGWLLEFSKYFDVIHVICLKEGEHHLPENVHVHSLGKEDGVSRAVYIFRFYKYFWTYYIRVSDVGFVFFHMGAVYNILALPFFIVRKLKHTAFIWWKTHGHINVEGRIALLFVDRVYTAVSQSFPVTSRKRQVVGHAIDTELFNASVREYTGNKILFVGRISRSKRIEHVISVTAELVKMGIDIETKIIGSVVDKQYFEELCAQVENEGMGEHITIIKGMSHEKLVKEYQSAEIFINPSDNDGLDKVVLEAMLCGCLPITSNVSFEDILASYQLYMKKGDISGYAHRISELLRMSGAERKTLSTQLQHIVVNNHALRTLPKRLFGVPCNHD